MLSKDNFPLAMVMIQPPAMPGSYLNDGKTFEEIEKYVMYEADSIAELGFDGYILQNMHDGPVAQTARPESIAFMTILADRIKTKHPDKVLGILVNWDGVASLAVAAAARSDFIRVEHLYTGVSIDTLGFHYGQCADILSMKKRLGIDIPIYADAMEVNANYPSPDPKPIAAKKIVKSAYADGVFMSGSNAVESESLIKQTRKYLPNTPIFLGGGATGENIGELLKYYDGVSVATWIKNGDMRNPIDPDRAKVFLDECKKAKEWRDNNK